MVEKERIFFMVNPFIKVLFMCVIAIICSIAYAFMGLYIGSNIHFIVGIAVSMVLCGLFGWSACRSYDFKQYCKYKEHIKMQMAIVKKAEKEESPFEEFE